MSSVLILPPGPIVDRIGAPKSACRPPGDLPESSPDNRASLTCPHAVHLYESRLIEIPVDGDIALRAGILPNIHGDPADRIIVATAMFGHRLVTTDRRILAWPGHLSWLDARE